MDHAKILQVLEDNHGLCTDTEEERHKLAQLLAEASNDGGLGELIANIGFGRPVWPCPNASQDVAMLAFVIHSQGERLAALQAAVNAFQHVEGKKGWPLP